MGYTGKNKRSKREGIQILDFIYKKSKPKITKVSRGRKQVAVKPISSGRNVAVVYDFFMDLSKRAIYDVR
jgi:hypothetical protein